MPRQLWIADKFRLHGLKVREVKGWETRGSTRFNPKGVIGHHTAGPLGRVAPSLNVVTNGRPGLSGPLCQVLIDRNATCHIIAAGRANHAGRGGWKGLSGNTSVFGIEVENNGVGEPWSAEVYRAFVKASAALLDNIGASPAHYCGHKEWAPRRKIDPAGLDMNKMRRDIATELKGGVVATVGRPVSEKEMAVLKAVQKALGVTADGIYGPKTKAAAVALRKQADQGGGDSKLRAELKALLTRR